MRVVDAVSIKLSVCCLPLEIRVCLNSKRNENGSCIWSRLSRCKPFRFTYIYSIYPNYLSFLTKISAIMKLFKPLLNVVVILFTILLSSYSSYTISRKEYNQVYEDACHMSDLIRCYEDALLEDTLIKDYGCFEELEGIYLYDDGVVNTPVDLSKYIWCY